MHFGGYDKLSTNFSHVLFSQVMDNIRVFDVQLKVVLWIVFYNHLNLRIKCIIMAEWIRRRTLNSMMAISGGQHLEGQYQDPLVHSTHTTLPCQHNSGSTSTKTAPSTYKRQWRNKKNCGNQKKSSLCRNSAWYAENTIWITLMKVTTNRLSAKKTKKKYPIINLD